MSILSYAPWTQSSTPADMSIFKTQFEKYKIKNKSMTQSTN